LIIYNIFPYNLFLIKNDLRSVTMGANTKSQNLQDNYLNQLRKEKMQVVVYLTNGVRLKGVVRGFDNFVILLKESSQQLIYKHAVSTIIPEKDLDLRSE
jgi:host factor-I protein